VDTDIASCCAVSFGASRCRSPALWGLGLQASEAVRPKASLSTRCSKHRRAQSERVLSTLWRIAGCERCGATSGKLLAHAAWRKGAKIIPLSRQHDCAVKGWQRKGVCSVKERLSGLAKSLQLGSGEGQGWEGSGENRQVHASHGGALWFETGTSGGSHGQGRNGILRAPSCAPFAQAFFRAPLACARCLAHRDS